MCGSRIIAACSLALALSPRPAWADLIAEGGATYGGLQGEGEGKNTFDSSWGWDLGLGWGDSLAREKELDEGEKHAIYGIILRFEYRTTDNRVGRSLASARFWGLGLEGRRLFHLFGNRYVFPTLSIAAGYDNLAFEQAHLANSLWWLAGGGGILVAPRSYVYLYAEVQPYLDASNSLGHWWGIEGRMGLGFALPEGD